MSRFSDSAVLGYTASVSAAVMIGTQVASKATRDALFLSNFDIDQLPTMLIGAAVFSLLCLLGASRAMQRLTPARFIPLVFAVSAVLMLLEWVLLARYGRLVSVLLYLHIAAFGSFLISGFWSIVNERFDPRTAKRKISLIAGGGSLGGLMGGLIAERVAAFASISTMLPLMSVTHLVCGILVYRMSVVPGAVRSRSRKPSGTVGFAGIRAIGQTPYLRNIACLILATTMSATVLDYVFKANAVAAYGAGESLMRYFAIFYAGVGLLTFLFQTLLGRVSLEKLGLAGTIVLLPITVAIGGLSMLLVPGLALAGVVRGSEAAMRSSLFRSGYELLYTPVPVRQKRSAKSIIDVGFDRLADTIGALVIRAVLWLIPGVALSALLGVSLVLAAVAILIASRLHQGYVNALKHRLVDRAEELEIPEFRGEAAESIVLQTIGQVDMGRVLGRTMKSSLPSRDSASRRPPASSRASSDTVMATMTELRSGSVERVRNSLKGGLDRGVAGQAISLLAWNEVSDDAINALQRISGRIVGELSDSLLDPQSDFAVRRRIPRVLAVCDSSRAVDGLIDGFSDHRFEVRYQCAAALTRIHERSRGLQISEARIRKTILRELDVDGAGWTGRRLVDGSENSNRDELIADRANLSLEHVFRLLSLILEPEPLHIALQGLYTNDPQLRGTAMEYLESVLPPQILSGMWPMLEDPPNRVRPSAPKTNPRAELLMSQTSIQLNLKNLRKKT